jgi:c-di-GMP-related signal transduction protein
MGMIELTGPSAVLQLDIGAARFENDWQAGPLRAAYHEMCLRVVAEGVDHGEQLRLLKEQGCDELQGFLVSGALEPDEFLRFYARYERSLPVVQLP